MKIQMKLSVFIGSLLLVLVVLMVVIGTGVINTYHLQVKHRTPLAEISGAD